MEQNTNANQTLIEKLIEQNNNFMKESKEYRDEINNIISQNQIIISQNQTIMSHLNFIEPKSGNENLK